MKIRLETPKVKKENPRPNDVDWLKQEMEILKNRIEKLEKTR